MTWNCLVHWAVVFVLLCTFRTQYIPRHSVKDAFDCAWSANWTSFLKQLQQNAADGFPVSMELAAAADSLLTSELFLLQRAGTREFPAWSEFNNFICPTSGEPVCFYGLIAACWVLIRSDASGGQMTPGEQLWFVYSLLGLSEVYLDFSEDSSWPVVPFDIIASVSAKRLLLPSEVQKKLPKGIPPPSGPCAANFNLNPGWKPLASSMARAPTLRVWEFGIHKTQSADALSALHMAALKNGLTMTARNLIQRQWPEKMPRCELYEIVGMECDMQTDEASEAMNHFADRCHEGKTTRVADVARTMERVLLSRLIEVDLLVLTTSVMLLLAAIMEIGELSQKPMVLYTSTQFWDQSSLDELPRLRRALKVGAQDGHRLFAAVDSYNQHYVRVKFGLVLPLVPGLALYTGLPQPQVHDDTEGLLVIGRPGDYMLHCVLRKLVIDMLPSQRPTLVMRDGFLSYSRIALFSAAAIFPYTYFFMTFNELHRMSVPMFFPSVLNKHVYQIWWTHSMVRFKFDSVWTIPEKLGLTYNPWNVSSFHNLLHFDYFRKPGITMFDSMADLLWQARPAQINFLQAQREKMRLYNAGLEDSVLAFWSSNLKRILLAQNDTLVVETI